MCSQGTDASTFPPLSQNKKKLDRRTAGQTYTTPLYFHVLTRNDEEKLLLHCKCFPYEDFLFYDYFVWYNAFTNVYAIWNYLSIHFTRLAGKITFCTASLNKGIIIIHVIISVMFYKQAS